MKLLERGAVAADTWVDLDSPDAAWPDAPVIVTAEGCAKAIARAHGFRLGARLRPDQEPEILRPWLGDLALVAVTFPIFRDGRAFTQARTLREYLGFSGIIRAEGHILPDQYGFLLRCGVTSVALADDTDIAPWEAAARRFDIAYQHGQQDGSLIGAGLRRRLHLAG